jgi:hypothetical protein
MMAESAPSPTAAPVPNVVPVVTPAVTPVVVAATPSVTPTVTATPDAAQSPEAVEEASEDDPLSSGITLKPGEIKHKVIVKALASVWVRYKVDRRPAMKFILRKDRILVLRARDAIRFQVSNPKGVTLNYNNHGSKLMRDSKNAVMRQETPTIYFPTELSETISEPFPGEKPLSKTSVPLPPAPTPSVTPSP